MAPPREPKPRRKQRKKSGAFFKRHHGTLAILIVLGWLVPPLAVLVRFGIGFDFFLNIILTCLGYFPGHAHNFYLQNLRNNQGRGRTPKWALKAGLVQDETEYIKSTRAWGSRYDERNTRNAYDDDNRPYEDEFGNPITPAEAFIENHGIKPAQPAGGLGERGNDTMHYQRGGGSAGGGGDLLDGLPDEDRARRKREKANRRHEYGSGLDEQDQWEADQAARNANGSSGRYNGDSLLGDLEDPDAVARPLSNSRSNNPYANRGGYGNDDYSRESRSSQGSVLPSTKKSGRSKKSERYGIKSDHADLASTGSSNYGRSSNSRKAERNNDAYDIVDDDRRRSSRRTSGEEDFMNHQF